MKVGVKSRLEQWVAGNRTGHIASVQKDMKYAYVILIEEFAANGKAKIAKGFSKNVFA